MYVSAIIAAGGQGKRLGTNVPKQLLKLGDRSVLQCSIEPFEDSSCIDEIIVVLPQELMSAPLVATYQIRKPTQFVPGGLRRQDSVLAGFERVSDRADVVVIHDAARPFVTLSLIERTVSAAVESGAAVAALPVSDTVKFGQTLNEVTTVKTTLPRESIYLVQTPQAFRTSILRNAIDLGDEDVDVTDEATLVERAGHPVHLVAGESENVKITTEKDLAFARSFVSAETQPPLIRVGMGYDLHRLVKGRPLILGGVEVPYGRGLAGHSDGDALCHAATDAILGAAGAGDIGYYFPDADPRWEGSSSVSLLRQAVKIVRRDGFIVENLDITVIAEQPRIGSYRNQICVKLADAIGIKVACVNVKGKSNEGVGELGRGEAIAVHAVALLRHEIA